MAIFPLAPDQTVAQMWSNGVRGGGGQTIPVWSGSLSPWCWSAVSTSSSLSFRFIPARLFSRKLSFSACFLFTFASCSFLLSSLNFLHSKRNWDSSQNVSLQPSLSLKYSYLTHHCSKLKSIWIGLSNVLRLRQPPTQYRLYGRRFLQVKRPNQQYQTTEGTYSTHTNRTYNNLIINTKHSKSPSPH